MDAVLIGTAIAPSQPQARNTSSSSTRLEHMSATRSPRSIPAARSAPARRATISKASRWRHSPPAIFTSAWSPCRSAARRSIAGTARSGAGKAKIGLHHPRIGEQLGGAALEHRLAGFEHVAVVVDLVRGPRIHLYLH